MTQAAEKGRWHSCPTCSDTGLVYPPRRKLRPGRTTMFIGKEDGTFSEVPASVSGPAPIRALPLPCGLCSAGEIELQLQAQMFGQPCGPEIEIMRFREARDQ